MTEALSRPRTSAVRVGLTLGGIVLTAVVIFGLGVMEGSRVAELVPAGAPPPSELSTEAPSTPAATPPAPAAPIDPDKLTFYDRLSGIAPAPPVPLPEAQPPAPEPAPAPAASPGPVARQPEAKAAAVAPVSVPRSAATPAVAGTKVPTRPDPAVRIRKLQGEGRFAVQMAAVSERSGAEKTAALIKRNGFEAVTVMASVKGRIWYRIRTGSFPSRKAAAEAAAIFRSDFGLNAIPVEN